MNVFTRLRSDERGISAVVVAVSAVALFGALALTLDTGSLLQSRRASVTATDASALTGARTAAFTASPLTFGTSQPCPSDIQNAAVTQLTANQPTMTLDACTLTPTNDSSGFITIDARKPVATRFAGIFNASSGSAFSSSSVKYGFPIAALGLQPFAICLKNTHIQEWLHLKDPTMPNDLNVNTPPSSMPIWYTRIGGVPPASYPHNQAEYDALPTSAPFEPDSKGLPRISHAYCTTGPCADGKTHVVHYVYFDPAQQNQCGTVPGNWGVLDFDGGNNAQQDTNNWIQNGYSASDVGIGNCDIDNVLPNVDTLCPGSPGAVSGSNNAALDSVLNTEFQIAIFDDDNTLGGNQTGYNIWGFVGVILRGYQSNGTGNENLQVEFTNLTLNGKCCKSSGPKTGDIALSICAGDHDPVADTTRCALS